MKKRTRQLQEEVSTNLTDTLPALLQRAVNIAKEKGASSWLTTLPIAEHGFSLHKGDFRDALCLRYDWKPKGLPSRCVCDKAFTVEHSLSCPRGGFPSLRHNELRDITAKCMGKVCHNVGVEPPLQPLTGEAMNHRTANIEDGAHLDIMAQGPKGSGEVIECVHFLTYGCSTLSHTPIKIYLSLLPSANTSRKKEELMTREYRRLNTAIFHPSVHFLWWNGANCQSCV